MTTKKNAKKSKKNSKKLNNARKAHRKTDVSVSSLYQASIAEAGIDMMSDDVFGEMTKLAAVFNRKLTDNGLEPLMTVIGG